MINAGSQLNRIESVRVHMRDPLYRNGYALMLNTAITSFLGLIYGFLAAKIYPTADIGRATAQIAAMMFISALTQMNFTSVLLRFLPRAGNNTRKLVVRAYLISTVLAASASTVVVVISHYTTGVHSALHMSLSFGIFFVFSTSAWSIFNLQDGTMTGLRRTIWVPVENGSFNIGKIILLFALKPLLGANGIFISTAVPVILSLIPVNYAIFKRFIPRHTSETAEREQEIQLGAISKYMAGDYISTLFGQSMTTLMPVLVASVLGNTANGYFYYAQVMGMSLDLVAFNLAQSLTVEASGDEDKARQLTIDVCRRVATIVLPLAAVMFVAAPLLLLLFGRTYSEHATWLLRLMALSTLPKAIIAIHIAMARVHRKTYRNAITAALQATLLIGGSVVLMKHIGIDGVGYAAIISQTVVALVVLPWMIVTLQHQGKHYRSDPRAA